MSAGDIADETREEGVPRVQLKSKAMALGKKVVNPCLQADAPAHDPLPGHGKGTADSFGVSSLA